MAESASAPAPNTPSSWMAERVYAICFEDLNDATKRNSTVDRMLAFWYSGSSRMRDLWWEKYNHHWSKKLATEERSGRDGAAASTSRSTNSATASTVEKIAAHSSTKDPGTTEHLRSLIERIDGEYYNGDIAWVNSILPCQKSESKRQPE